MRRAFLHQPTFLRILEESNVNASANLPDAARIRRVLVSSVIGTAIEWYDFFLYATASALVFAKLFFPTFDPVVGTIAAFGSFAVGYIARPFGAVFFGHFGDRIGRKTVTTRDRRWSQAIVDLPNAARF